MVSRQLPCALAPGAVTNEFFDSVTTPELATWIEYWLDDCRIRQFSPNTIAQRRIYTDRLIRWLRHERCERCGVAELRRFFADLHNYNSGEQLRPTTVDTYHRNFSALFNWMVRDGILSVSPMQRISKPVVREDQIQPLSVEQVEQLQSAAKDCLFNYRNRAIVLLLADTGLRATELCSLKLRDFDFNEHSIRVLGKGNKFRTVFFGKDTSLALLRYLRRTPRDGNDIMFVCESGPHTGEPMTRSGIYVMIRKLGRASGISNARVSPHTLRHTFATEFMRNEGYQESLMSILGHNSTKMTQRYVTLAKADARNQHRRCSPVDRMRLNRRK